MQVSSWIAARLAVLVEFAVFLISSTTEKQEVEASFVLRPPFFCPVDFQQKGLFRR